MTSSEPTGHAGRQRTRMAEEAAEAPRVVRDLLERNAAAAQALGADLSARPLRAVLTCARGSSDHAATYAKYLIETRAGLFTASPRRRSARSMRSARKPETSCA